MLYAQQLIEIAQSVAKLVTFRVMCGKGRPQYSGPKHQMNELNWNQTSSQPRSCDLTRIIRMSAQTIPKQAVDIVDLANSVDVQAIHIEDSLN